MIRTQSHRQRTLAEFDWPFQTSLDKNNRWVKMSDCIPWDALGEVYYEGLPSTQGRRASGHRRGDHQTQTVPFRQRDGGSDPGKPLSPILCWSAWLSDGGAVDRAKSKPKAKRPMRDGSTDDDLPPSCSGGETKPETAELTHKGKLILNATVAPQAIRFPTDLSLLNAELGVRR